MTEGNKMKKKLFAFLGSAVLIAGTMAGCGEQKPEEIVYLEESEINDFFDSPTQYKGKYVKLSGQLLTEPDKEGDTIGIQAWHDIEHFDQDFYARTDNADGIEKDDYVLVEGKIDGILTGENAFGGEVKCPLIVDAKVTKSTYIEVMEPTIAEISPAASQDQNGVIVTVDKVEYAKDETRLYVTIKNTTDYNFLCGTYSAKLIVNGQQLDRDDMNMTLYNSPELTELSHEVMAGTSASGTLVFPAIEQNTPFQFVLPDSHSDNYDLMFTNYMVDVPVK